MNYDAAKDITDSVKSKDLKRVSHIVDWLRFSKGWRYNKIAKVFIDLCPEIEDLADFENLMQELEACDERT